MPTDEVTDWSPLVGLLLVTGWQCACWIAAPTLTASAPPLDVVENAVWGTERVLVSYKNPALASLLQEAARLLTHNSGWPAYVLSQLCVATTVACVYTLGKDALGRARAAAGALCLLACYYFNWRTPEFNQDIVQIPFWAAVALALWRAIQTNRTVWWLTLGAAAAGCLYAKLAPVVLLATAAGWLLIDTQARARLRSRGPWLALATFILFLLPLAHALMQDNAAKCIRDYAVTRGNMRSSSPLAWLAYQAAMVLPMAAVLWLGGLIRGRRAQAPVVAAAGVRPAEAELRRYLIFLTSGPLLLTVMAALLHRTGAKLMWGVPMLNLAGLLLVSWLTPQVSAQGMRRLACVLLLLISAGAASFAAVTHLQPRFASQARFVRMSWPQHDIARRMRAIWTAETGAPLRIVTGDKGNWVSGLVALADGEPASVFTQANYELSPWITPARLAREGTLVVWEERGQGAPAALCPLIAGHPGGSERFPFAVTGKLVAVTIGYAVIAPAAAPLRNTP